MMDWLREKKQTPGAIERFWRQVLVSAINEDLERWPQSTACRFSTWAFSPMPTAYEMGVPAVPLGELYSDKSWAEYPNVKISGTFNGPKRDDRRRPGEGSDRRAASRSQPMHLCWLCRLSGLRRCCLASRLNLSSFSHSPITGIHLWFDRPITESAARHTARPHNPVDVQQGRRPVHPAGRERLPRA